VHVVPLLFETFGGFGPGVVRLLKSLSWMRLGRLSTEEYKVASWSTRMWKPLAQQILSVALHRALADEIRRAVASAALRHFGDGCGRRGGGGSGRGGPAPTAPVGACRWGGEGREGWGGTGVSGSGQAAATDAATSESAQPVAEAGDLERGPGWWRGMGFAVAGCEDEGEGDEVEEGGGRTPGDVDRSV
jgi:hypothetical protein